MSENESNNNPNNVRRKTGLGRGLDALLGEAISSTPKNVTSNSGASDSDTANNDTNNGTRNNNVYMIAIGDISPHPDQPRRQFKEDQLNELAHSIAQHGIIQPIVLRPHEGRYQLVAGERRWRAAQRARLHEIPAIVRPFTNKETVEIALIENIQREDLNPIEEAEAYKRLGDEFGYNHNELAKLVDKSRSHIANMLRLIDLDPEVRNMVIDGHLSMGHARALLKSDNMKQLAQQAAKKGLSVRQVEALARQGKTKRKGLKPVGDAIREISADVKAIESHLSDLLGLKVKIDQNEGGAGAVTFEYKSLDQLDMLCQRLTGESF